MPDLTPDQRAVLQALIDRGTLGERGIRENEYARVIDALGELVHLGLAREDYMPDPGGERFWWASPMARGLLEELEGPNGA